MRHVLSSAARHGSRRQPGGLGQCREVWGAEEPVGRRPTQGIRAERDRHAKLARYGRLPWPLAASAVQQDCWCQQPCFPPDVSRSEVMLLYDCLASAFLSSHSTDDMHACPLHACATCQWTGLGAPAT